MTTKTWNGSNADWYANSGGDWSPAGDPGSSDDVVINSGESELLSGDAAISVASISIGGNGFLAIQDPGATQSVSGNVSVTAIGSLQLDGNNIGGTGGSKMTIGGTLTNTSTNGNGVDVGNTGITSADTLTVNGTGGLSNGAGSQINIEGSASVQATVNVANAAAGFGTAGVETGTVFLENDALLEFKSGQITTINGELWLDGANSRVADAGSLSSNSALTGLSSVSGFFFLENGASVAPTGNVSVTGNGAVEVGGANVGGPGGDSLTIGGTLTNSGTNGNGVDVGNVNITSADTLTVNGTGGLSNAGQINIEGSATVQATLNVANAAAGFGTANTETGTVFLQNDALLEFKSGQITTINGELWLDGANSRVADAGSLSSNSALTGLSGVSGFFFLENGASVAPTGSVSVTGNGAMEVGGANVGGPGGDSLTIGGNLANSSTNGNGVDIGNVNITSADALTVNGSGGLSNGASSEINIEGSATVQATLNVANAAAGFGTANTETGTVFLQNDALLEFKSGQIATVNGTLWLDGANARVADAGSLSSNSALTGLSSVSGFFFLENGASVASTGNVSVTGNGAVEVGGANVGGPGGDSLTIGGNLANSSTNGNGVDIGNTNITSADALTVNGSGGLSNGASSEINIEGSASVQATLNVANAAAGFGTAGVETGEVFLENDALLEFKSGQIATVNGTLWLDGASSRVADAGTLGSNSALTGLTGVAGNFWLENGASVAPTGNVSVTGNGTVEVDGNNIGGAGGSSLTIGGTLTNSSTNGNGISIGNTNITSTDTLTVSGSGGLSNTGDINIQGASASAKANLVVTNAATSSAGTIFLNSFGVLTATSVNITGGTLEGTGTVTGALNLTGGTVVGGSLNSTPGTLNVSGAYSQSGTGVLQADINTGDTQQSSIVNVTGNPGTPGLPGSVNLSGGALLIDAQSNLTLNTLYTVMTFAAGELYGQFSQVETNGALGSHTGNGDSVNLGNGDTLEVLYNEATGDVQVDLVATPASTTYTWDAGSGTWNASSSADWNPPGDGTTPSATSNVTIGSGAGGTVTLAQDQTIASLSIANGYTLSGSGNSITTTGNVSLAKGAALSVDDMNVGGVFTDSGSADFAGVLTINRGGQLILSNGTITGGINGTGVFESKAGTTDTLSNVTIYQGATFTASGGATTDLSGAIVDKGTFVISGASKNAIVNLGAAVTLSGGGKVTMKSGTSASAFLRGSGLTLTNDDTIQGAGFIGDSGALALVNQGTIDANVSGETLSLNQGNGGVTNTKTLEATGGGTLELFDAITNTGGTITASATNSTVDVEGTIIGGTLKTASGGVMQTVGSSDLNGVAIAAGSTYTTGGGATTQLDKSLSDKGTFLIDGSSSNAIVNLGSNVTLSGGGVITLESGSGTASIEGAGHKLTNASGTTIQGTGIIGAGSLSLTNSGAVDANVSGATLTLNGSGGLTNNGVFEATNRGLLDVAGALSGTGQLEIGAGSEVELGGATSESSTFLGSSSAKFRIDNATTTSYSGVINSFASGDILELGNTDATSATPTLNGANTTLTVDLSGGGALQYTLVGNLTGDTFSVTHVNNGADSDIAISSGAAFAQAASLLEDPSGSSFVDSSGVFGASLGAPGSAELNLAASPHAHS